jgi:hypothetical protein
MDHYITPEEILTRLPRKIRQDEQRDDLIDYIINAYKDLEIPQDQDWRIETITLGEGKTSWKIPSRLRTIKSVWFQDGDYMIPVYYQGTYSPYCKTCQVCNSCDYVFSIEQNIVRFPFENTTYCIIYNQLYSDECLIVNNRHVINYIIAHVQHKLSYERALPF